jgi:hypothetical protein
VGVIVLVPLLFPVIVIVVFMVVRDVTHPNSIKKGVLKER